MRWTEIEIKLLTDNLALGYDKLSLLLKRDKRSVRRKVKNIGLLEEYRKYNIFNGCYLDISREKDRREKISNTCKANKKSGGIRHGSGRGKKGTYKGYWCDSSYELAWVIYQIEHNIKFKRNTEKFIYFYNNLERKFIPDFIIDNTYYEIKGYEDVKLKYKIKYFPYDLKVLYGSDLEYIFNYVVEKYGRNYISLYEDKIYKSCKLCNGYIHKSNSGGLCMNCIKNNKKVKIHNGKTVRYKKCSCGNEIHNKSQFCKKCYNINQRKVIRPNIDILLQDINNFGYSGTGRKYGVSDNSIRKWIKNSK
jgi:hypothetical protein